MTKHFLIAEDDEDDITLYKEAILSAALPIEVDFVIHCEEIFKSIAVAPKPDLIIVDGNLPGKSLLDCIKEIRSHDKLSNHPLVVLTGSNHQQEKSYAAGINLFLEKPSCFDALKNLFKRLYQIDWSSKPIFTSAEFYSLLF